MSIQKKKLPISAPNQYRNRGDTVNKYFKISDAKNFAFYKVPKGVNRNCKRLISLWQRAFALRSLYGNCLSDLISEKKGAESINREKSLRAKTESAKQRISDLDKLFSRIYEDNILGKLSDERYSRMANEYEAEQKRLISEVEENEKVLIELQKQTVDMKMLYQGLMEFTEMKQLTPTVVNKLIERIEIHNNEKKHSHNNVKVDIYFTAAGLFDIPTEQQLIDTMERVKQKKAEKSA